jgi:hypothetical protein
MSASAASIEGVQGRLDRTGRLLHPERHRGQDADGDEADQRLEQFLAAMRKFGARQIERDSNEDRQSGRRATPPQTAGIQAARPVCLR